MKFTEVEAQVESYIQNGEAQKARKLLGQLLAQKSYTRKDIPLLAAFLRRLYQPYKALHLLRPYVLSKTEELEGTQKERLEYGASLIRIGAFEEGLRSLASVQGQHYPEMYFYSTSAHMARWDYESALTPLRKYLTSNISAYKRLVGLMNLAFSYFELSLFRESLETCEEIISKADTDKHQYLLANAYLCQAQNLILSGKHSKSVKVLNLSEKYFGVEGRKTWEGLTLDKWRVIKEGFKKPQILKQLNTIAMTASREYGVHETQRECDYYRFLITQDRKLFEKLSFGTSYPTWKEKLARANKSELSLPENFIYTQDGRKAKYCLDLKDGHYGKKKLLPPGSTSYRIINALTGDLYRPLLLPTLYEKTYPDEFFNPYSGPNKLKANISFLRKKLSEAQCPLEINFAKGGYFLSLGKEMGIKIEGKGHLTKEDFILAKFFNDQAVINSKEIATSLDLSVRQVQRVLKELCEEEKIKAVGGRRSGNYTKNTT